MFSGLPGSGRPICAFMNPREIGAAKKFQPGIPQE
jgi:hypothetical protein